MDFASTSSMDIRVPPPAVDMGRDALWRSLMDAHHRKLHRFIHRHIGHMDDAEDLAQQTFIEAVHGYARFRKESELSTWLYGIAKNLVRNYLSRSPHRRYEFCSSDELPEGLDSVPSCYELLEREQQFRLLVQMLGELPESMYEALWLVAVDGLTYEATAQTLAIPIGTVRSRVSRARQQLRMRMDSAYGEGA